MQQPVGLLFCNCKKKERETKKQTKKKTVELCLTRKFHCVKYGLEVDIVNGYKKKLIIKQKTRKSY